MNLIGPFSRMWAAFYRRYWSAGPSSATPESTVAWEQRQFRYYATLQPFTNPLSLAGANLTGETWEMRNAYREWAFREPAAKAALETKCLAVCKMEPSFLPNDTRDSRDREATAWVKYALGASDGGIGGLIFNMLMPSLFDGFSVNEKVNDHVNERDNRYPNWWTISQFASIDTAWTRFRLDKYRQVIGVQSIAGTQGAVYMNPKDFVIFTHLKIFENPFGISDLRAAVRACRLIESAIRFRHLLLSNYSGPFLKGSSNDPGTRAKLLALLEDARGSGFIVVPDGTQIEVINLATAAPEQFRTAIEDYRQEIVMSIQGAYLQLLGGGQGQDRGDTTVHADVAELLVWWLALWVCQVVNKQVIPDLVVPNYGNSVGFPKMQLGGINEELVAMKIARFQAGKNLGLTLSKSQAMEAGGFESPADESDALQPAPTTPPGGSPTPQAGGNLDPLAGLFSANGRTAGTAGTFR